MKKVQTNSDFRQLIDGKQAVTIDRACTEYIVNKAIENDLKVKLDESAGILKGVGIGKFETSNYTFDVEYRSGSVSIDIKAIELLYPEILKDERVLKTSKSYAALKNVKAKV